MPLETGTGLDMTKFSMFPSTYRSEAPITKSGFWVADVGIESKTMSVEPLLVT